MGEESGSGEMRLPVHGNAAGTWQSCHLNLDLLQNQGFAHYTCLLMEFGHLGQNPVTA